MAESTPVLTIPKEPAVASYAALLTKQLTEWDAQLGQELSGLDLSSTAGADPERSRLFLEHRLRQELAVPALQLSKDPVLRQLTAELQRIPSFNSEMTAHVNLQMGPIEPLACQGCEGDDPGCNRNVCVRERTFAGPAVISAAGLDTDCAFNGHPIATSDGVTTTPSNGLGVYLQAVEAAGISRDTMRTTLNQIVRDLARRSAILESRPLEREPDEHVVHAVLRTGFARWLGTYYEQRILYPPLPLKEPRDLALFDAYVAVEATLYRPFRWSKSARLQSARTSYYRKYLAVIRAIRDGKDPRWESEGPPYDEEACLAGPPEASRQCAEILAASALFIGVLETLPELESNPQGADEAALNLALAFERLTLSAAPPAGRAVKR